jgi:hypothetical protein
MYSFLAMGGFAIEIQPGQRIRPRPEDLIGLFEKGVLEIPDLEDSDIDDRSKANWLTKAVACIQIVWFLAQLVGRAAQHLPITTLELFTSGIVFCGSCTYAFWWKKPFDIGKPVVLYPTQQDQGESRDWPEDMMRVQRELNGLEDRGDNDNRLLLFHSIIVVVFAALHIVGWNFQFPSDIEKILWRIMSVACGVIPLVILVGMMFVEKTGKESPAVYFLTPLGVLYVLVRVYLFVEIFIGLRAVPAGVYRTPQWSQYFPAFG